MTKAALRVCFLASTLLFCAAYSLAAGQATSPASSVTGPTKDRSKGTPASVGFDERISSSAAVAEAETVYADLADSYGIISTIDSDLFATYQGKDRTASERAYSETRRQLTEKLSKIFASGLSPLDARALEVMNRHLRENFPEKFSDQNAPPEHCQDAQRQTSRSSAPSTLASPNGLTISSSRVSVLHASRLWTCFR